MRMASTSEKRTLALSAAELIVRKPWQVIMICYIPVLLSLFVLPFVPMYVDTGTNAIFARKTTISNRINSGDIIRQILPKKPNNVTAGLEDNVQQLVANYSTQAERSDTVFGDANHFSEIHVLVHAFSGDVLEHDIMEQACGYLHHVYSEQVQRGICLPKGSLWSIETETRSLAELTVEPSPAPAEAPSQAPSTHADGVSLAPAGDTLLESLLSSDSPLSDMVDDAFGPDAGAQEIISNSPTECIAPFSIFNVRETLQNLGYGPQLQIVDNVAPMVTESAVANLKAVCSLPVSSQAGLLCSSPIPCDPLACEATNSTDIDDQLPDFSGLLGPGKAEGPQCLIAGMNPCDILNDLNPTAEEIQKVMAIPEEPLDAQGCDNFDFEGLDATVEAFKVLRKWAERSPTVAGASVIVDALMSADFGTAPDYPEESFVTRFVFGVPRVRGSAPTDFGEFAANAATDFKTSQVEFIWRQWAYFDVYANRALMRDLGFSLGSLLFLFVYALTQIGSVLLTVAVITSILCTLPLALATYSVLLGIRWFGVLHFLGLFIILGIGADDVFVVLEHWKHSADQARPKNSADSPTVVERMAWCIEHSVLSITATSATTIAAFAANMTSSITPVRLFGLFMVILVSMNFFFVVTLLLAFLAVREKHSSKRRDGNRAARAAIAAAANARSSASNAGNAQRRMLGISFGGCTDLVPLTTTPTGTSTGAAHSPNDLIPAGDPTSHHPPPHEPYPMSLALTHPSEKGVNRCMRSHSFAACSDNPDEEASLLARPMVSAQSLGASSGGRSPMGSPQYLEGSNADIPSAQSLAQLPQDDAPSPSHSGSSTPQRVPRRTDGSWVPSVIASGDYSHSGTVCRPSTLLCHAMAFTCSVDPDTKDITCVAPTSGTTPSNVHAFLGGSYARWLHSWRHFILLMTLILVCFCSWRASMLELPHSRPTVWRKGSNMHSYYDMEMDFAFGRRLERIPVTLSWGFKAIDTGSLNRVYEHTDAVLDPAANFTSPEAQKWLLNLCIGLQNWSEKPDSPIVLNSVQCPMPLVWQIAATRQISFPMPSEVFKDQLRAYSALTAHEDNFARIYWGTYNMSPHSPSNPYQDGFLASADTFKVHPDLNPATYGGHNYWLDPASVNPRRWDVSGTAGDRSRDMWYRVDNRHGNFSEPMIMNVEFTLKETWAQSFQHTLFVWETWEMWMQTQLGSAPEGLKTGFQTGDRYSIMEEQAVMFQSGQVSLALSLALALLALVAVAGNVVLAFLATVCMISVLTIFLGVVELMGWTLGIVECVGIAIMVGLEVDYIVHVATCIGHSPESGRAGVDYALRTMGMSVVSGYTTTVGAALFLLPCEMGVFGQFGIMVVITLTTALVFALVVFPALCYCVNVHNTDVGNLSVLFQGRWEDFWGRRRNGTSAGSDLRGSYIKVGDDGEFMDQVIELTGLEAVDAEARAAAENEAAVLGSATHTQTGSSPRDASVLQQGDEPESLEPDGLWRGRVERKSGDFAVDASGKPGDKRRSSEGSVARLPLVAAAQIFRIESVALQSDGKVSGSSWGSHAGDSSTSRGAHPGSTYFREWSMSGIASSASGGAQCSGAICSGMFESQAEIESLGPSMAHLPAERMSVLTSGATQMIRSVAVPEEPDASVPSELAGESLRPKVAEVGAHAIGGSTEGLVGDGSSGEYARKGVDAVGGSVTGSGSVASKESTPTAR